MLRATNMDPRLGATLIPTVSMGAAPGLRVETGGLRVDAAPYLVKVADFFLSDDDYMDYAWNMTNWKLTGGSSF